MNIFDFEKKYKDKLEDISEWAYLRISLAYILKNKKNTSKLKQNSLKIKKIFSIFYGFKNWFRKYTYLVFSDSLERRMIEGLYTDKIVDDLIIRLDQNKTLLIELPNPLHYPKNRTYTKNIVSRSLIDAISKLISLIVKSEKKIPKLDKILIDEKIYFNYSNIIKNFSIHLKIYKLLLYIYRPKIIFINCAYCNFSLVKAANELSIKVVELQHGIINTQHYGYNSSLKLEKSFYPNIIFTFGKSFDSNIINDYLPIGSFYLEYLQEKFKTNSNLNEIISKYDYSVGISMQDQDWEQASIYNFFIPIAKNNLNILFILIPRKRKEFPSNLPSNLIIVDDIDCYNIIMHCDVHSTLYSSCALEAPSLGVPNILINIDNYAENYYREILSEYHTKYITDEKSFLNSLKELYLLNKIDIMNNNKEVFVNGYNKNIKKAIKYLRTNL